MPSVLIRTPSGCRKADSDKPNRFCEKPEVCPDKNFPSAPLFWISAAQLTQHVVTRHALFARSSGCFFFFFFIPLKTQADGKAGEPGLVVWLSGFVVKCMPYT